MTQSTPASQVLAIIVSFRPDLPRLEAVLRSVQAQVGAIYLFDNATQDPAFDAFVAARQDLLVHRSASNIGLAAGINRGIEFARGHGFSHVLTLDQDSVPDGTMVEVLLRALGEAGAGVAAVGPQFVDSRNGVLAPFVRIGFPLNQKLYGAAGEKIEADFLISSGSLIPLRVLNDVGDMDASLFIDNVDLEWSFRARARGYRLLGVCDARMGHRIGDALQASRWRRGGRFVHGPVRLYYMMRNRVLLYRRKETPRLWVAQDVPRLFGKLVRMSVFEVPRSRNLRAMLQGLRDGLLGRSGPMPGR